MCCPSSCKNFDGGYGLAMWAHLVAMLAYVGLMLKHVEPKDPKNGNSKKNTVKRRIFRLGLVSGGVCVSVWGWWVGVGRSWFVLAGMAWVGWGRSVVVWASGWVGWGWSVVVCA